MQKYKYSATQTREKRQCFCTKADRNKYKAEFIAWYDIQAAS